MSMHADEDSDEVVVPEKRSNKEGLPSAEIVEGRASPKGNGGQATAVRTPSRGIASSRLEAVRQAARQSREVRFTALLHHITIDLLKQSYRALKRDAAPGIDGVTWWAYGENLEAKLKDLHERIHKGSDQEADGATATGDQDGVAQKNARPHRQDRRVDRTDAQGAPQLLRRFGQRPESVVVYCRGPLALAEDAQTAQSAGVPSLG